MKKKSRTKFCPSRDLNPGPLDWQSSVLTTRPTVHPIALIYIHVHKCKQKHTYAMYIDVDKPKLMLIRGRNYKHTVLLEIRMPGRESACRWSHRTWPTEAVNSDSGRTCRCRSSCFVVHKCSSS